MSEQNLKLGNSIPESPKAKGSPGKKAKTPSPAKKSPKAKTPSPRKQPAKSTPAKQKAAASSPSPSRRAASPKTPPSAQVSLSQTPTVTGRFSISRISTPSPGEKEEEEEEAAAVAVESATPKIPQRRKSMKASARRSMGKGALEVIRRRSGTSRANLKGEAFALSLPTAAYLWNFL